MTSRNLPQTVITHAVMAACLALAPARADVRMPAIFGDHMVLQQNLALPVWGWADPGEKVTVTFGSKTASATADADGKWMVKLSPEPANATPQTLVVKGRNTLTFEDVLVGTVWVASGQSNMEYGIQSDLEGPEAIAQANDSEIRMFFVPWKTALEPQTDIASQPADSMNGKWQVCSPEVMAARWAWNGFSAVGYYFARSLREATKHPVGVIESIKGGTPAQAWISVSGLEETPPFAKYLADHEKLVAAFPAAEKAFPEAQAKFQDAMKEWNARYGEQVKQAEEKWKAEAAVATQAGQPAPPKPALPEPRPRGPESPDGGHSAPGNNFNGMIAPLIPYAINGVIWYQGESNGDNLDEAVEYEALFPRLITDWRRQWDEGDFPFLFVQLANFQGPPREPSEGNWAWVRDAQRKTLSLPNTGMASAIDLGDAIDIHPKSKRHVGERLALAARKVAGGEKIVASGPLFESMTIEGNRIRVRFASTGSGLTTGVPPWSPAGQEREATKEVKGFGIAGADRKFVWANAVIDGDSVVVSSAEVKSPAAVRYSWANNPQGNLYNREGLPASSFRTDDWPAAK